MSDAGYKLAASAIVFGVVVLGAVGYDYTFGAGANHQTRTDCTIVHKERLRTDTGGEGQRRLETTCGVFEIRDGMFSGFDSADLWARIREGGTYDLETGGYRVPVLSTFPLVLDAKETSK